MSSATQDKSSHPFPIAAVGGSAGGLAPTIELLQALGAAPGLAVVVIHHLDPTHESALVEVLSRATSLPVVTATDGVRVERDHVYVMAPNTGLLIHAGALHVVPRTTDGGLHLPIDRFCESLAADHDGLAVGVILSGSGFDGTEGVRAIKRAGGITLAQDASATFTSMPESAVRSGSVDVVAPPAGLAAELRRIALSSSRLARPTAGDGDKPLYSEILAAMRKTSGVDFARYKRSTIQRRIQRRVFLRGQSDLASYAALLKNDPAEVVSLCGEVLIHVTSFFREPEAFAALCTLALPKLCENRRHEEPLRIWVPGCSTGEEVYSLAICLIEFLESTERDIPIKIFGTDLSQAIVDKARSGRYPNGIARDVSPARLKRFFVVQDGEYQISREVRDLCVFAKHDVTRDPPFSSMDVISCRNLLIYLGPELQERVIGLFHYSLKEPGFLVLGGAETVRNFAGFEALDAKNRLYARTSAAPRLALNFGTPDPWHAEPTGDPVSPRDPVHRSLGASDVNREADRLVLAEFAPPGVVVTSDLAIVHFRGQTGPFLSPAPGTASLDLFRMAREELRLPLRHALDQARETHAPVTQPDVRLSAGDRPRQLTLRVVPFSFGSPPRRYFLVLFEEAKAPDGAPSVAEAPRAEATSDAEAALRQELASTRQYLESVIEQLEATNEELKAANEEVVSSNEELRSTNEELQSAKEELQATNEELHTVNDEMGERHKEAVRLNDDLSNVLSSAEIPLLIVTRDARLRSFTPAAGKIFGLVGADVGRPLSEVRAVISVVPSLPELVSSVRETLQPVSRTVQDARGAWLDLAVRPYLTLDGRIDGAIVAVRDVDVEKRAVERLDAARKYSEDVIETVRDGLLVLDGELRVSTVNSAFVEQFRLESRDLRGRRLHELGPKALATPALLQALTLLQHDEAVAGVRVEIDDPPAEPRVSLVNGRRIANSDLVLLAFEDITVAERARVAAERAEVVFRSVLAAAPEGVLIVERSGQLLFANPAATELFGYTEEEMTKLTVDVLVPETLREAHAAQRARYQSSPSPRPMGHGLSISGRRKDGALVPLEVTLSPMVHAGGQAVVAFVTDITQRRDDERDIRAYQARLQRMAFDTALAEDRERRRIAIGLHDQVGQALALAQIKLASLRPTLTEPPRAVVEEAVALLEEAMVAQRSLVFELSPPVLYDLGLGAALGWLADDVEKRYGVKLEVEAAAACEQLGDGAKAIVFRAVRELVMNVLKHARVPTAKISLRHREKALEVDVQDKGVGFEPDAAGTEGFGLLSVREQIRGLGGSLEVRSSPSEGALVRLRVPLTAPDLPDAAAPKPMGGDS